MSGISWLHTCNAHQHLTYKTTFATLVLLSQIQTSSCNIRKHSNCHVLIYHNGYTIGWASLPSGKSSCTGSPAVSLGCSAGGAASLGTAGGVGTVGSSAAEPPFPKAMACLGGMGVCGLMQPRLGVHAAELDDAGLKVVCAGCCPAIIDNISKVLHWTICICCIMAIAVGPT